MTTIRSRPESIQRFESVWDALCDDPEEARAMQQWSLEKMALELYGPDVYIGDDGYLYYNETWVIQGKQA